MCVCVSLKALIFAAIAPRCLQGSAQVLLSLFHFPNTFRISGKLQPSLLWAARLVLPRERAHAHAHSRAHARTRAPLATGEKPVDGVQRLDDLIAIVLEL